jgi:hypothetical protein
VKLAELSKISEVKGSVKSGNTKWGSMIAPFTSCLTGLELAV